jgi:PAS domain S-box-containing protein
MKKEPEIVKQLREAEKLGVINRKSQILENSINKTSSDIFYEVKHTVKKAKEKLRLGTFEEKFRTIFENYAVAITLVDNNERIISWNKYTEELFNMGEKDLFMRPVESLYPADEWAKIRAENVRQKGMKYRLETKLIKKNQEFFDAELSLCVLKDENENIVGSIGIIKDITKLKETEKELEESEEKFRQLYENAPIPYHTLSPNGIIIDVNEKWCQTLGYSKREVIGRHIFDFIDKNERESAKLSLKEKISSKKFYVEGHERKFLTKSGEEKIFVIHDFFSYDNNYSVKFIQTTMQDITLKKKIEAAVQESEEKFKSLVETSADIVFRLNKIGTIEYVSPRVKNMYGYEPDELIGKHLRTTTPVKEIPKALNALKIVFSGKSLKNFEINQKSKSGKIIPMEINAVPVKKDGKVVVFQGVMRNITDRKRAEEEIKRTRDDYLSITNLTGDIIVKLDVDGNWTFLNDGACEFWGKSRNKLFGMNFSTYLHPEDVEKTEKSIQKLFSTKKTIKGLINRQNTPNGWRIVEWNGSPIFDNEGRYIGLQATGRDITEGKKAEEELKNAHEKLKEFNQLLEQKVKDRTAEVENLLKQKDAFIIQLSHDLRSPLTPLIALLPTIEEKEQDPVLKEELGVILRNVNYLSNLVEKTIELAKLSSPITRLSLESTTLLDEVNKVIEKNVHLFKANNVEIKNHIDKKTTVNIDKNMFEELFENLISNAVKYSKKGGNITIDAQGIGKWITVSVKDTGIGLDKKELIHIFEEFYKADWSRHDHNSTGLGLSICKNIVERHGGKIWAESNGKGKGTTMFFTIPSS